MPSLSPECPPSVLRDVLWRVNETLLTATQPEELYTSLQELESLARGVAAIHSPTPELAEELRALRADLRRAAGLVQSGLELQAGWARILGAASSGYTAEGQAAPLETAVHVAFEG